MQNHQLVDIVPIILRLWTIQFLIMLWAWGIACANTVNTVKFDVPGRDNCILICLPAGIDTFDPTNHRSRITQIVIKNIFDSLTTRNNRNHVIPQLAESWRLLEDTRWQFNLRRDVLFHNGQPLTAKDVKFTIERVIHEGALDGATSPRKNLLDSILKVVIVNDYTVNIHTRYPWPNLPLMLSLQEIVPASYFQTVGAKGFYAHPVGAGPFKVAHHEDGKEILLERFDNYYCRSNQRPPVQEAQVQYVIFKEVASCLDQLALLKKGQCDIIFNVPPESIPVLKMSPHIRLLKIPATKSYFAEINCAKPPLNDFRIRQAFNYAVDMEATRTHKLQGHGSVLPTVLLPHAFGYNPHLQPYAYDLNKARQLLKEAAYSKDRPIVIYCNHDDLLFADSISLYLTKLGLKTRMVRVSSSRPQIIGAKAPWDIFVGSWGNSTLDPAGILPPKFRSQGYANFSGYASFTLDDLLLKAQRSMDAVERAEYYHRIQDIIYNDAPMIFGYAPDEFYAIDKRVKNFKPSSTGMIELHDVFVEKRE